MAVKGLSLKYETGLINQGYTRVIGIDEVGRGAWAGPLVLGAFTYTVEHKKVRQVNDSKLIPLSKREKLSNYLNPHCKTYEVSVEDIDRRGLGYALNNAINNILNELYDSSTFFLIDGKFSKVKAANFETIIDGDAKVYSIAAASIVAKVYRDNLMRNYVRDFPEYKFETHVGYGTRHHREAIKKYGICEIHRKSFKPIASRLS